jgi:hypothetical protein
MKKEYTLTELVQIAELTKDIELLKLVKQEIEKKIEVLLIEYGMELVCPPKEKRKIGFKLD